MIKKIFVLGILLALMAMLVGCGDGDGADEAGSSPAGVTLNEDYPDALPVSAQLSIGTLALEGTDDAVTVAQAGELLPPWQMLQALQASGTAAQAEVDAVLNQIQAAMTPAQLTAIKEMRLTPTSMLELAQERGLGRGLAGDMEQGGGFSPSAGMFPPAGGGQGGQGGGAGRFGLGVGMGQGNDLSPEEQQALLAERMNDAAGTAMTGMLISLLEARAEGETWEVASPNQASGNVRVVLGAVAEATGLGQQEIIAQARDGKTLAEIIAANGADKDEIITQVVAAETERVNQAVADGTLEQADADELLDGLEARVKETLEGPLEFGGRGPFGDGSGE